MVTYHVLCAPLCLLISRCGSRTVKNPRATNLHRVSVVLLLNRHQEKTKQLILVFTIKVIKNYLGIIMFCP